MKGNAERPKNKKVEKNVVCPPIPAIDWKLPCSLNLLMSARWH